MDPLVATRRVAANGRRAICSRPLELERAGVLATVVVAAGVGGTVGAALNELIDVGARLKVEVEEVAEETEEEVFDVLLRKEVTRVAPREMGAVEFRAF